MCLGDVGGNIDEQLLGKSGRFAYAFSLGFRQWHISRFGYKINFAAGKYAGADGKNKASRNYRFESNVFEVHFTPEYVIFGHPFDLSVSKHFLSVFAGVGFLHSSVSFEGKIISGDTLKPSENVFSIPFGISYQYALSPKLSIGAELNWRLFQSDFVDGITTRFSKNSDILANFSLTLSYNIFANRRNRMYYPCRCNWN